MNVELIKLSVCPCGFPLLNEAVPLGTRYEIDPGDTQTLALVCGGCRRWLKEMEWVWVEASATGGAGFLPREAFGPIQTAAAQ